MFFPPPSLHFLQGGTLVNIYKAIRNNTHRVNGKIKYFAKGAILKTSEKKTPGKKDPLKHFELVGAQNDTPNPQVDPNINPAVLEGQLQAALDKLDKKNDVHWTAAGLPKVEVVIQILGREVSREDITAACPGFCREAA